MADELQDKKLTQDQADYYMATLELDLVALFKVMENDMLNTSEAYEGTPEKFIQEIISYLTEYSEINKDLYFVEKKVKPVGAVSTHADGTKWKKQPDGTWNKITEKKEKTTEIKEEKEKKEIEEKVNQNIKFNLQEKKEIDQFINDIENNPNKLVKELERLKEMKIEMNNILKTGRYKEEIEKFKKFDKEIWTSKYYQWGIVSNSGPKGLSYIDPKEVINKLSSPKKGDHWGKADSKNNYAKAVAFVNSKIYKPVDYLSKKEEFETSISSQRVIEGLRLRKYAQKRIKDFPIEKNPYYYRGMTITKKTLKDLQKEKNIDLTGCSAFSMNNEVAEHYMYSEWTKRVGKGNVPIFLKLKRNPKVDNTIGMVHDYYEGFETKSKAPYEVLTGIEKLKINDMKERSDGAYEIEVSYD